MIEIKKDKVTKKVFPIDLQGNLENGWVCVEDIDYAKIIDDVNESLAKYQGAKPKFVLKKKVKKIKKEEK